MNNQQNNNNNPNQYRNNMYDRDDEDVLQAQTASVLNERPPLQTGHFQPIVQQRVDASISLN